jgi:hypothetical protein
VINNGKAATIPPHRGFLAVMWLAAGLFSPAVLAATAQKGHSWLNLGGSREQRAWLPDRSKRQ